MTIPSMALADLATLSGGLLILRVVLGLGMAAHGAQKLFGWFGGYGLAGTGGFLETLGFKPGKAFAVADGVAEFVGGLLVAFGLLGPVGPALIISGMLVAIVTVHWSKGFFGTAGGYELPLLYAAAALMLAFIGFGQYSLDAVTGLDRLASPAVAAGAVILGAIGGLATLALRRPEPASKPAEARG